MNRSGQQTNQSGQIVCVSHEWQMNGIALYQHIVFDHWIAPRV